MSIMQFTGTVTFLEIEGGVWVIRSTDINYNPTNLPEQFRQNGLRVDVEARRQDDMASISMVGPMIELVRIRRAGVVSEQQLGGTQWALVDLQGTPLPDSVRPTLAFSDSGAVSGLAGCNRFNGRVTIGDGSLAFGPLATTRMFCGEPAMTVESRFLGALQRVVRYELRDGELHLSADESGTLVRLRAAPAGTI